MKHRTTDLTFSNGLHDYKFLSCHILSLWLFLINGNWQMIIAALSRYPERETIIFARETNGGKKDYNIPLARGFDLEPASNKSVSNAVKL